MDSNEDRQLPVTHCARTASLLFILALSVLATVANSFPALAQENDQVLVVVSDLTVAFNKVAKAALDVLDERTGVTHELTMITVAELSTNDSVIDENPRYVLALGSQALAVLTQYRKIDKVCAALIPYAEAASLIAKSPPNMELNIVVAEQPDQRVTELTSFALPKHRRIGVLHGASSEERIARLLHEFEGSELTLVPIPVGHGESTIHALENHRADIDALLAIPDPDAVNSNTARNVIRTSHRFGIPLVGYSSAFVEAGAVASVFSSPEQFGTQIGENDGRWREQRPNYPGQKNSLAKILLRDGQSQGRHLARHDGTASNTHP